MRVSRSPVLWTVVLFFAGSILFGALHRLTEHSSTAVTIAVQFGALAIVIAALVVVVRRLR